MSIRTSSDWVNPSANPTQDSFGRLRVSTPLSLFDSKQLVDNQPLSWDDQQVSGTATSTYDATKVCSTLAVSNLTAGRRVRQTFERFAYQPGKSQAILMTANMGNSSNGITKRLGYYDDNNGVFFQTVNGVLAVGIRKAGVDTIVPQPNWIFDSMDGTGPSKITLDLTKVQIFNIDFEWLGVGSVRFGFVISGQTFICHRQDCANQLTAVYNLGPNQPLRYEIINSGTGPAASMDCICGSVVSEAGYEFSGFQRSVDTGSGGFTSLNDASLYPIVAIRLKASYTGASSITVATMNLMSPSTISFRWVLVLNPTFTGTALSFSSAGTSSAIEFATPTNGTTITAEGTKFQAGYVPGSNNTLSPITMPGPPLRLGATIAGVADILVLAAQRIVGTGAANYFGSLSWTEQT